MTAYELSWSMYGTATVEAESEPAARAFALRDLMDYSGFGMDFTELDVDGADVTDVEVQR